MKLKFYLLIPVFASMAINSNGQTQEKDSTYKKCFVGSSLFVLGNLSKVNTPEFVPISLGYRITILTNNYSSAY